MGSPSSSTKTSPSLASAHLPTPEAQRLLKVTSQDRVGSMGVRRCPILSAGMPLLPRAAWLLQITGSPALEPPQLLPVSHGHLKPQETVAGHVGQPIHHPQPQG